METDNARCQMLTTGPSIFTDSATDLFRTLSGEKRPGVSVCVCVIG